MGFFEDLREQLFDLRESLDTRHRGEVAAIKAVIDEYEEITRRRVAGLIGAREYSQFDGELDSAEMAKLLRKVKADVRNTLQKTLLLTNNRSLKDKLNKLFENIRITVYESETRKIAEIYAGLLPEGSRVAVDISNKEIADLLAQPLAGLAISDYVQKALIELMFGSIQAITNGFTDATTFEGGIREGLANIGKKFNTAEKRMVMLGNQVILQSSNKALRDISNDLRFKE